VHINENICLYIYYNFCNKLILANKTKILQLLLLRLSIMQNLHQDRIFCIYYILQFLHKSISTQTLWSSKSFYVTMLSKQATQLKI